MGSSCPDVSCPTTVRLARMPHVGRSTGFRQRTELTVSVVSTVHADQQSSAASPQISHARWILHSCMSRSASSSGFCLTDPATLVVDAGLQFVSRCCATLPSVFYFGHDLSPVIVQHSFKLKTCLVEVRFVFTGMLYACWAAWQLAHHLISLFLTWCS